MSIDDETIIDALHTLARRDIADVAPVDDLVRCGRAARTRRRMAGAGAGLAVVGLAAVLAVDGGSPSAGGGPAAQNVSLALAAQNTAATGFHISVTLHTDDDPSSPDTVLEGAFDPATQTGYLNQIGVGEISYGEAREVEGVCYAQQPAPLGTPGSKEWVKAYSCGGYFVGFVPDPDAQLKQLEKEGSAKLVSRTGSGQNELDTWQYSLTVAGQPSSWGTWTYTVVVDVAQQRVVKVTGYDPRTLPQSIVEVFSDFGTPVAATAPSVAPEPSLPATGTATP